MIIANIGRFTVTITSKRRGETWLGTAKVDPPLSHSSFDADSTYICDGLRPTAAEAEQAAYAEALEILGEFASPTLSATARSG
jgi:hypothetical protein